jgi:hypothetical protein
MNIQLEIVLSFVYRLGILWVLVELMAVVIKTFRMLISFPDARDWITIPF